MIVTLDQENVGKEMFACLAEALNTNAPKYDIYLTNEGGECAYGELITEVINQNKGKVSLTAFSVIASSAFEIFFQTECAKTLMPGTIGMFHLSYGKFTTDSRGEFTNEGDKAVMHKMKEICRPKTIKLLESIGVTEEEMKKFNDGEDVWVNAYRLAEMLAYQQNNK